MHESAANFPRNLQRITIPRWFRSYRTQQTLIQMRSDASHFLLYIAGCNSVTLTVVLHLQSTCLGPIMSSAPTVKPSTR
jgi:hypothetical protein